MEYHFSYVVKPTYLHVIGSGPHSVENLKRFIVETNRVRVANQLDSALVEVRFTGPSLNFGSIYSVIADNLADSLLVRRIAYVDTNAEHKNTEFAELAANKLGVHARAFRTVADAEKWLSEA